MVPREGGGWRCLDCRGQITKKSLAQDIFEWLEVCGKGATTRRVCSLIIGDRAAHQTDELRYSETSCRYFYLKCGSTAAARISKKMHEQCPNGPAGPARGTRWRRSRRRAECPLLQAPSSTAPSAHGKD